MKRIVTVIAACVVLTGLSGCKKQQLKIASLESADLKKAEILLNQNKTDSAFYYFAKTTGSKDSLEAAMSYYYMGFIQSGAGDHYGAQESLTMSLRYLSAHNIAHRYCLASDYNELGMTSSKLANFKNAIDYFDLALKFCDEKDYRLIVLNNKANALRDIGAHEKALKLYNQVLKLTERNGKAYARLLNNMASAKWQQDSNYRAAPDLLKALKLRQELEDLRGQNSSYSHLTDYYTLFKPDSALFFAGHMYSVANKLKSPDARLDALRKLIKLSPPADAKRYFSLFDILGDSIQTARNAAKNQFTLIRYHVEESKADNLRLQKENSERKYELSQKRIQLYCIVAAFVLISFLSVRWYKYRKGLLEKEKQEAVIENQRKASKKVHDTLANDIYRIMKTVQYGSEHGHDWLVDNLDNVYQRARDLSYDIVQDADYFESKLSMLLKSFASDETRVVLVGNSQELWQQVSAPVKTELKYILQELMVNMQKHSKAMDVTIRFERRIGYGLITYLDNGTGIPEGTRFNNGLTNTGNRIKTIGGKLTFAANAGKGLQIDIEFPLI